MPRRIKSAYTSVDFLISYRLCVHNWIAIRPLVRIAEGDLTSLLPVDIVRICWIVEGSTDVEYYGL